MWEIVPTDKFERDLKWYSKKRRRELAAVIENLERVVGSLNEGVKPLQLLKHGFVHKESGGVMAVDQKGGGPKLSQTRLYFYVDERDKVVSVLAIGDKNSQSEDNKLCASYVDDLQDKQRLEDEKRKAVQERPGDGS
jgi:hypothetical protein